MSFEQMNSINKKKKSSKKRKMNDNKIKLTKS